VSEDAQTKKDLLAGVFSRAAETYGQVGPRYFAHFGQRLVELARLAPGSVGLDVATGRGAILFPAARQVGSAGRIIGIDLASSMVEETTREIRRRGVVNAQVRQMDAEHLEFADETFDAVLCGFGLFFFPYLARALTGFRRVLKPNARLTASTWGKDDASWAWVGPVNKAYGLKVELTSHKLDERSACAEVFRAAGFADVRVVAEQAEYVYANEDEWWKTHWSHGYRAVLERVPPDALDRYKAEIFAGLQAHKGPSGIREGFAVLFTTGRKPAR